jgi:hypothetical protein
MRMSWETAGESALELAARRLDRALAALERKAAEAPARPGDLFRGGPEAAELERLRGREQELEAAGAEASAALGRAIQEIRAALNGAAHG